jgi:hypothetical protein
MVDQNSVYYKRKNITVKNNPGVGRIPGRGSGLVFLILAGGAEGGGEPGVLLDRHLQAQGLADGPDQAGVLLTAVKKFRPINGLFC